MTATPPQPVLQTLYELLEAAQARGADPSAGGAFDPATSPLHRRAVFIVGAPRSGTTWLHQLLATHPDIATAGESHLFCEGIGALFTNHEGDDSSMGLRTWVTRPELVTLARALADGVFLRLRDGLRPAATRVLDKTPNHVPHAALLAEVYPDACYVHIVRDGRDAVGSAKDLWGWSEDYGTYAGVAARWRDAVTDVRRHLSGLNYLEVRYEDLLGDPVAGLAALHQHLGLSSSTELVRDTVAFGRTPINVRPSNAGVGVGKWSGLPPEAQQEIAAEAGDLLVELGYLTAEAREAALALRPRRARGRGRGARSLLGRSGGSRHDVRAAARTLSAALDARDQAAAAAALRRDVVLVEGERSTTGADDVAAALLGAVEGHRLIRIDADAKAAAIRWADQAGSNRLYVCHPDREGRFGRIELLH